jgi:octaprenyl-diphosphate synthase
MNIKIFDQKDFPAYLPKLNQLYDELFSGGKGFRSKLIQLIGNAIETPAKTQHLLCQTIEFVHNASLLHDDLIDRSVLRRGKPAAWTRFSPEYAVLAGDYLLARVMVNLSGFGNLKLVQFTSEIISELLEGEWLQDSLVKDFSVDLSQLDRVHHLKTGSLFKWCLRAPFMSMQRDEIGLHTSLSEMGLILGQLFQRADDLLDFDIRNEEKKEPLGDLKSGYLNSFSAYVAQNWSKSEREKLKSITDIKDFKAQCGGVQNFNDFVSEFDKKNEFLIQLYLHHLNNLEKYLHLREVETLTQSLKSLPNFLYYRKKA